MYVVVVHILIVSLESMCVRTMYVHIVCVDHYCKGSFFSASTNSLVIDLSIGSTETKYIKLNTKTQIYFVITFDFCIHFKKKNFFSPFVFLSPLSKCIKKSSNFHLNDKKYFGFPYLVLCIWF